MEWKELVTLFFIEKLENLEKFEKIENLDKNNFILVFRLTKLNIIFFILKDKKINSSKWINVNYTNRTQPYKISLICKVIKKEE